MDTIQEIDDLLELNPFYPEHYEHFHSEAVQVLIDAKYEILRLQTIIAELKSQTVFPTFKDEWGNSDWRDKGEMGG
jgi:hypothetical protein